MTFNGCGFLALRVHTPGGATRYNVTRDRLALRVELCDDAPYAVLDAPAGSHAIAVDENFLEALESELRTARLAIQARAVRR